MVRVVCESALIHRLETLVRLHIYTVMNDTLLLRWHAVRVSGVALRLTYLQALLDARNAHGFRHRDTTGFIKIRHSAKVALQTNGDSSCVN